MSKSFPLLSHSDHLPYIFEFCDNQISSFFKKPHSTFQIALETQLFHSPIQCASLTQRSYFVSKISFNMFIEMYTLSPKSERTHLSIASISKNQVYAFCLFCTNQIPWCYLLLDSVFLFLYVHCTYFHLSRGTLQFFNRAVYLVPQAYSRFHALILTSFPPAFSLWHIDTSF